jgi:hypothetical protein
MAVNEEFGARPVRAFLPGPGWPRCCTTWPRPGSQVVVATHSPIIAAIPGAHLLELGSWGMRPAAWEDLSLVIAWRQFMRDPRSYFRHLFEES